MKPAITSPRPTPRALLAVANRALAGSEDLPTRDRIELLNAVATIVPDPALAKAIEGEAFMLREADDRQLKIASMLQEAAAS